MRASASSTPVTTPARAAFSVTRMIITHLGAPSATAASRNAFGISASMFSVVRTTTGNDDQRQRQHARVAGERPRLGDDDRVDEQPDHDRRRRQQDVVDEARRLAEPAAALAVLGEVDAGEDADRRRERGRGQSTMISEPTMAFASPPSSAFGGGVDSVSTCQRLRPLKPSVSVSHRIQISQTRPKAIAASDSTRATALTSLRRRCSRSR